jgi:hypothetical protein
MTVFLVVVLLVFVPRYETNDDAAMNLIVAGRAFGDAPDEHLVFSNVLVGLGLQGLYRAWPEAPWYGSYLMAVTSLSLLAVCYALIRANPAGQQLVVTAGFLVAFGLPCVVWLQFTKAAFMAALAGLLLLLNVVRGRGPVAQAWAGLLFLILGSLVRFHSCLLAGAVLAPALAWACWEQRCSRSAWLAIAVVAGGVVIGCGLEWFNGWYYAQDPGWRGFYEFNAVRSQFTDYGRVDYNERTKPIFDAVGWSAADVGMLYSWNFADRQRFSAEKLRAVLAATSPDERVSDGRSWGDLAWRVGLDLSLLVVASFGLGCLVWGGGGWRGRLVPGLCLASAVMLCIYFFRFLYLPPHVSLPAFGGFAAATIAWSSGQWGWRDLWPWMSLKADAVARTAALALVGVLLAWLVWADFQENATQYARHQLSVRMVKALEPRPNQLYVLGAASFPIEWILLPLGPLSIPRDFKAVGLGTNTQTPITDRRLQEFGIADLYRALYERGDVFLVTSEKNMIGKVILAAYMKEHYGVRLGFGLAFSHPGLCGAGVYSLTDLSRLPPDTRAAAPAGKLGCPACCEARRSDWVAHSAAGPFSEISLAFLHSLFSMEGRVPRPPIRLAARWACGAAQVLRRPSAGMGKAPAAGPDCGQSSRLVGAGVQGLQCE